MVGEHHWPKGIAPEIHFLRTRNKKKPTISHLQWDWRLFLVQPFRISISGILYVKQTRERYYRTCLLKERAMSTSQQLPTMENQEENIKSSEGVLSAQFRPLTLGLILIILGPAFEALAVATILPKIVTDLGGLSFYGWSFSAYMLATLVGLISGR